jgi:hypothetical protein
VKCRTRTGVVEIPEAVLRAQYRQQEAQRRAYEPHVRGISFTAYKRLVCMKLQMRATDPGGDIKL